MHSAHLPELSAYRAQQAEKALKAFLTARLVPVQFTHELVQFQSYCEDMEPSFADFLAAAPTLNPCAVLFRSPESPRPEAKQAIGIADGIVRFIQQYL